MGDIEIINDILDVFYGGFGSCCKCKNFEILWELVEEFYYFYVGVVVCGLMGFIDY